MSDQCDTFSDAFIGAAAETQAVLLAFLCHHLTIVCREAYPLSEPGLSGDDRFDILRTVNEIQHSASSQLVALLVGSVERYPDDALFKILDPEEHGEIPMVAKSLDWALRATVQDARRFGKL